MRWGIEKKLQTPQTMGRNRKFFREICRISQTEFLCEDTHQQSDGHGGECPACTIEPVRKGRRYRRRKSKRLMATTKWRSNSMAWNGK